MSIFIAEPPTVARRYDVSPELAAEVIEATRHLCDYRAGLAAALETLAEVAAKRMPDEGQRLIEPLLRILGPARAEKHSHDLYIAACKTIGGWDPNVDPDDTARVLRRLTVGAAHDIADEVHRDNRICCNATKGSDR